jgi:3'-5' exoribonuclease
MTRRFVQQLTDGEAIEEIYLVAEKQLRANRNGNPYLQLDLRDRTGTISARLWNAGELQFRSFEPGDFLLVKGRVQLFQGALQIILSHLEKHEAQKAELTDFLPHTDQDVNKLLEKLRAFLRKSGNPHLKALGECFLIDSGLMRAFSQVPAGVRNHHAYVGGLLEHVVNMMEVAERIAPCYPGVDRDLLIMGIFLHDIGKTRELTCGRGFAYTDEGQLVGHIVIGVEMLNEQAAQAAQLTGEPFPRELLWRLKHMIVSHHGEVSFGSPVVPMTPEAIALHHLDNLDAKIHTFVRDIREDRNTATAWTTFNPSMGRRLFKGCATGGEAGENPDGPADA